MRDQRRKFAGARTGPARTVPRMTVIVRDFGPADAETVVAVRRAALPAGNGPMLAVNRWFGYEICATEVRHVRKMG